MNISKAKVLRVTMTVDFVVPMHDEEVSEINGWTLDQVKKDWLENETAPIGSYHATRDHYQVGYSEKVVGVEELSFAEAFGESKEMAAT